MRITYEQLARIIQEMSIDQRSCDVTVVLITDGDNEIYPAELRIIAADNDVGLETNHPVLFVDYETNLDETGRHTWATIDEYIKSLVKDNAFSPVGNTSE